MKSDEGNCQIQNHEISNPNVNHPGLRPPLLAVMQGGESYRQLIVTQHRHLTGELPSLHHSKEGWPKAGVVYIRI